MVKEIFFYTLTRRPKNDATGTLTQNHIETISFNATIVSFCLKKEFVNCFGEKMSIINWKKIFFLMVAVLQFFVTYIIIYCMWATV